MRASIPAAPVFTASITKTGNAHPRTLIVEAAWADQKRPSVGGYLTKRQQGLDQAIIDTNLEGAIAATGDSSPKAGTSLR